MQRAIRWLPIKPAALALAVVLGISTLASRAPQAGDLVDLTITFQGAMHGEIAPCG